MVSKNKWSILACPQNRDQIIWGPRLACLIYGNHHIQEVATILAVWLASPSPSQSFSAQGYPKH